MSTRLERAELLLQQNRYEQAAGELQLYLSEDPNDSYAHSIMAISLANLRRFDDAISHAHKSIELGPDMPYAHAALAQVELERNRLDAAVKSLEEAIACAPFLASYHGLMAVIRTRQRQWLEALAAANRGLEHDPEEATCLNMRALALRQLGENVTASETIRGALANDPNDPFAHANEGWMLLEAGDAKQALVHFREALRLEPELEYARLGIIEALKSQNFLYRVVLRFLLMAGKLSATAQWGMVFGFVILLRFISALGRAFPAVGPLTYLVTASLIVLSCSLLFARPFANFVLLFHPLGRLAMTKDQISQGLLAAVIGSLFFGFYAWSELSTGVHWNDDMFLVLVCISIPAMSIHDCEKGWPRWAVIGLMLAAPVLFYLPLLLRGLGPQFLVGFLPKVGFQLMLYHLALVVGAVMACSYLEDVEIFS